MHCFGKSLILVVLLCWQAGQVLCQENCPNAADILPCTCREDSPTDVRIYCNDAEHEDEIEQAFLADFPMHNLTSFHINDNLHLKRLVRNLFLFTTFEKISIKRSNISEIQDSFFDTCYRTVTNISIDDNTYMSAFPFDALPRFTKLTYLGITKTALTSLPRISSSTLTVFDVSHNSIEVLDDFLFVDCPQLQKAQLHFNIFSDVPVSSFIGLDNIESIRLDDNLIQTLRTGTFAALLSLQDIYVDKNPLVSIEDGTFVDLPSLINLRIGHSSLTTIRNAMFFEVFNIEDFAMKNSSLREIEPYTFVEFHHNPIIFQFNDNSLTIIEKSAFAGVSGGDIRLHGGDISVVETGAFTDLMDSIIYLNENSIATLDESWLGPIFEANNTVHVPNNPLECGCDIAWIVSSDEYLHLLGSNPECANGTALHDLDYDYYLSC